MAIAVSIFKEYFCNTIINNSRIRIFLPIGNQTKLKLILDHFLGILGKFKRAQRNLVQFNPRIFSAAKQVGPSQLNKIKNPDLLPYKLVQNHLHQAYD